MAPSMTSNRLFGAAGERVRPGWPDTEWSVWITGMDDIHDRDEYGTPFDILGALQFAAEHNAAFADMRVRDENAVTSYAVVLHWGYAWTRATEHAHGRDCGLRRCGPCSGPDRDMHRRPADSEGGAR